MTLNNSVTSSHERIAREQLRIKAIEGLREKGFEYDPAGFDFVSFQVVDSITDEVVGIVPAFKNENAVTGWKWIDLAGEVRTGHWNELVAHVTEGSLYPYAAMSGRSTLTNLARGNAS